MSAALTRFRVLAWATGVFLLLLTLHVVLQAVQASADDVSFGAAKGLGRWVPGAGVWVPIGHGYLYLAYVVVAVDLWFRTRLPFGRMVLVVLAGTVPAMSFVAERWVTARVRPMLGAVVERPAGQAAGQAAEPPAEQAGQPSGTSAPRG